LTLSAFYPFKNTWKEQYTYAGVGSEVASERVRGTIGVPLFGEAQDPHVLVH
jgi:hypothetical protein